MKARALELEVYRWSLGDCTNGGVTATQDEILVPCEQGPWEYDTDNPPDNLCVVKTRVVGGVQTLRLVPVSLEGRWTMFGGNYATTSDSRWGEMLAREYGLEFRFNNVIAVHDRVED